MCRLVNDAGSEEEQRFEKRMVQGVEKSARKAEGGDQRVVHTQTDTSDSHPQSDDADVLHRMISQQFFKVVLHDGLHHPEQA